MRKKTAAADHPCINAATIPKNAQEKDTGVSKNKITSMNLPGYVFAL